MSRKQPVRARRSLPSLDTQDLAAVSGGIIIYSSTALGGPDTSGALGGPDTSGAIDVDGSGRSAGAIIFWRSGG